MDTNFFEKYQKVINAKSLLRKSRELGNKGEIEHPFLHESKLYRRIKSGLGKSTVAELKDLSYTLNQAGIKGGHKSLSGQHVYQGLNIIKFKPFMEFALLNSATWDKINSGKSLNAAEKKERKEITNTIHRIYEGREIDREKRKKLAKTMNKIARDL